MENATDALHMAFGVLIFVLALSISISSFSLAQSTAQSIIEIRDRENDYQYIETSSTNTERTVGVESIIPTMYRAYRENYIIVFDDNGKGRFNVQGGKTVLFQKKTGNSNTSWEYVSRINLAESELAIKNQADATEFIRQLLYGGLTGGTTTTFSKVKGVFNNNQNTGLYSIINGHVFTETTGVYYIDDIITQGSGEQILSSDANKTEKRVITYTLAN